VEELDELERRIRSVNAVAPIIRASHAKVDLDRILAVGGFDLDRALEIDPVFLTDTDHQHDLSVTSVGLEILGALDMDRLNTWLGEFLRTKAVDVFRMKGILHIAGQAERYVFQGVHMLFDGKPGRAWASDEERVNRLVFIGRNLDRAELERSLTRCLAG